MVSSIAFLVFSIIGYFYEARHKTKFLAKELMINTLEERNEVSAYSLCMVNRISPSSSKANGKID